MLEFVDKQDWFKEIESIRIKQSLHPKNVLGDVDPEDLAKPSTASGGQAAAGHIINGKFHTKDEIQELQRQKMEEYFDLLPVAIKANLGLKGPLTQHSAPEKMSKLLAVDNYILKNLK